MSRVFDTIIVGAGPAGLTAAIYLARAGKSVCVFERETIGGKITSSPVVKNIPGFVEISGAEFGDNLYQQAIESGAEIEVGEVCAVNKIEDKFLVTTSWDSYGDYTVSESSSVIIAAGTEIRFLGVPGETELFGSKIHACVTCDGPFYKDREVAVIGGGNSAVTEAIELSKICKKVYILQNLPTLTAEKALLDELSKCDNVTTLTDVKVNSFEEVDNKFENKLIIKTTCKEIPTDVIVDGAFLAVGLIPQLGRFENVLSLNNSGYAKTAAVFCTKGVFVAGDCTESPVKQVVTACADGANAAIQTLNYLKTV